MRGFFGGASLLPLHIKSPRVLSPAGLFPLVVPSLQTILPYTHLLLHPFIVWVSSFLAAARIILQDICLSPLLPIPLQSSSITLAPYHKQLSPSSTQLGTSLFQMAGRLQWGTKISTLPFQRLCATLIVCIKENTWLVCLYFPASPMPFYLFPLFFLPLLLNNKEKTKKRNIQVLKACKDSFCPPTQYARVTEGEQNTPYPHCSPRLEKLNTAQDSQKLQGSAPWCTIFCHAGIWF